MANLFYTFRNWMLAPLLNSSDFYDRIKSASIQRDYRVGNHVKQIKIRSGQHDDNLILNYSRLIIDRSVSKLFGAGFELDFPGDGETQQELYVNGVLDANKQEILFSDAAILGAEQGTVYLKIMPDGAIMGDSLVPRLAIIDPAWVTIDTRPDDLTDVTRYTIQYVIKVAGKEKLRKQIIERDDNVAVNGDGTITSIGDVFWWVRDYESDGNREIMVSEAVWDYAFPPILHWKNLPNPTSPYGSPDITQDIINLQDAINFGASNINKIIRLYAHPPRYGVNLGTEDKTIQLGPDNMPVYNRDGAEIRQLEAIGDMSAAREFVLSLRQSLFDITQTVDITSITDKIGALTNFGLRVLYQDELAKLNMKRELYGDAIEELVYRLQVLANMEPLEVTIKWGDALPIDTADKIRETQMLLEMGIESKQTAAMDHGLDWDSEQQRMEAERVLGDNIGAAILRTFETGVTRQ